MNILVLAPHPDDEVIGCGGALCLHARKRARITAVFLTSGELGLKHLLRDRAWAIRESEAKAAAKIIGISELIFLRCDDWTLGDQIPMTADLLRPIVKREKPKLIYLPHLNDGHPDHQATLPILRAALRRGGIRRPELRSYEVWTPLSQFDIVEDISAVMGRKLKALRAHKSQLKEFDYARAITGLNQYRGVLAAQCRYAEVFQSVSL
jgi:LmbE family N-acetylglucosaminyl deacetylase